MTTPAPCRLYALLAREAPVGVILRRGPTRWVQVIRWDTRTDTFTPGHWFRGRLYEYKCDLSPSGDRFLYFAAKHNRGPGANPPVGYVWTAVSRPPYLTALALWSNLDTRFGGGLFSEENEIWLDTWSGIDKPLDLGALPPQMRVRTGPLNDITRTHVFVDSEFPRLLRDGWTWYPNGRRSAFTVPLSDEALYRSYTTDLYRRGGNDGWILHRNYGWGTTTAYTLHTAKPVDDIRWAVPLEGVHWADWDQQGRLVCAREGKLFEIRRSYPPYKTAPPQWREIADFNNAKPYLMPPPDWAKTW